MIWQCCALVTFIVENVISEGKTQSEIITCYPHEHAHTLNIFGSWQNVNPPFVSCILVRKYACVRAFV